MNQRAVAAIADAIVPIIAESLGEFLNPLLGRMASLEEQIKALTTNQAEVESKGKNVDSVVTAAVDDAVAKAMPAIVAELVAAVPLPKDGKDADLKEIRSEIGRQIAALPPPRDGKDADPAVMIEAIDHAIAKAMPTVVADVTAAVPPGKDGKDADPAEMRAEIARQVAALPPPVPGRDADPAEVIRAANAAVRELLPAMIEAALSSHGAVLVERCDDLQKQVAELAERDPAETVDWTNLNQRVDEAIQKAVAALPAPQPGKDGVGIADGLIDRSGNLIVTFSDGRTKDLGRIVDPDASREAIDKHIEAKIQALPKPKDGKDGLGFDDLSVEYDGERRAVLRFVRSDQVKDVTLLFPFVIDRGVFNPEREQPYERGDGVSYGGSFWIAQKDAPTGKPEDGSKDWRLSVKRGRHGRDGVAIKPPQQGPVKAS